MASSDIIVKIASSLVKALGSISTVFSDFSTEAWGIQLLLGYDVSQIGISNIALKGIVPALTKPTELCDYDKDRVPDPMVKFDRAAVMAPLTPANQVEITITGKVAGIAFEGTSSIRVIEP